MKAITTDITYATIRNYETIKLADIPTLPYSDFYQTALQLVKRESQHCVNYYAFRNGTGLKFICCIADDTTGEIQVFSHETASSSGVSLASLSAKHYPFHIYEREIYENFGVYFDGHPFLKPVRFAFDRGIDLKVNDYPFYSIDSDELHEVGVGPIHAGVIEPGHFRFICNGEMVLHLEIQLGWQHRGIESLYLQKPKLLQRNVLSEQIAGDTAVGHALTFAMLAESAAGISVNHRLQIERTIALELERVAMGVFDLSNLNVGIAYQLANSVYGALRTPVINYFQRWCGNRFGKSLIRVGGTNYPLTTELRTGLRTLLDEFNKRFEEMSERAFNLPSVMSRFEEIGKVTKRQMELIGAVGQAAKMSGLKRDTRWSHPTTVYKSLGVAPVLLESGDVWARFLLKRKEVSQSIAIIYTLLDELDALKETSDKPIGEVSFSPASLTVSLNEGWRGEICHCAVTDAKGEVVHYKAKDPSLHNWMALALSLRNLEISDFPINNKSYNLSYCGFDL